MTPENRPKKIRWLRRLVGLFALGISLVLLGIVIFINSGLGDAFLRRALIRRIDTLTGGKTEIANVSIAWLSLHATLSGVVVHGLEPKDTEPLFRADTIQVGLQIDSFWGRKVSLDELILLAPRFHIRVNADGTNNLPLLTMKPSAKPLPESLFDLHVRKVRIDNGWVLYNDTQSPLSVEGGDLHFSLDAAAGPSPLYLGNLDWKSIHFTADRFLPLPANLSAKFTLRPDGFTLEQGVVSIARSHLDAQGTMVGFVNPKWSFRYRGWVDLVDIRQALRTPEVPYGRVDVRGEGTFTNGAWHSAGNYVGQNISLDLQDFHAGNLFNRSSFVLDSRGIDLPDFVVHGLGGNVTGHVHMSFAGLFFRAVTHIQNVRLSSVLPAIDHQGFPVDQLHWDALISGDTIETWTGPFQHFEITGGMHWDVPTDLAAHHIPVSGDWKLQYRYDAQALSLEAGTFATPSSRGSITGLLSEKHSDLNTTVETGAVEAYSDFIHAIAGNSPRAAKVATFLTGSIRWDGKILGPTKAVTFVGHFRGENNRYGDWAFDSIDGDLQYSPKGLVLTNGHARRGAVSSSINATLSLTEWSFLPDSTWSAEINLENAPLDGIQQLLGLHYPVQGQLSGQFHGGGTRAEPALTGLFDLADASVYGVTFNRLRGELNLLSDEVRISDAELRVFAPGKEKGQGAGIVTGSAAYRFADHSISADLVGASLPLDKFQFLKIKQLPMAGEFSFRLKGSGPVTAFVGESTFRVVDFRVGKEVVGSFEGDITSDGKQARLQLTSSMSIGSISGDLSLGLAGNFPLVGKVSITNINLDPYLTTALHLSRWEGHATADGEISVNGELKHPENIVVDANFSKLLLAYRNVQLQNVGPVQLRSTRDDLQIIAAAFQGTDTNMQIGGSIQFSGRRALAMHLNGTLDLRLLTLFFPHIDAHGPSQINAAFEGTIDRPRITGRVHIDDASLRVSDFPTGLAAIKGDFIFDSTRLFFENVSAEAGGGSLLLSGSVNYGETPIRYDINAHTNRVRIRYPEGMSWLAAGSLHLAGTLQGGLLSGKITVERVNLAEGLDSASALVSPNPAGNSSPFLRNLQFDIEVSSTPDARMEWPGAELEAEANLRVRGTAEHPILLGHIHVLSGELSFHGNRYRVSRGDLNFVDPFRIDPVINVEATTTIQQYEITLNFNGRSSAMALAYRSDPPLPGNDIVTLLALGKTSSEASVRSGGSNQGASAGASALLSEAISSQLGGRLERLFGITRFRVDPGLAGVGSTGASQNAAARVTVEQQITHNLTITYVSNVSSTQQQIIQVEYNVNRNLAIVALRDYNGTFGIDVKITKRLP
ncbi:MAG TPA: translocation/assembly module TamB domain-containing protein [Candidatus Dormibacteraeota bacterium]|nr:translocation/assembly module TamB domain-containing protein [Candidatus Dormibacteraeota bacterium]